LRAGCATRALACTGGAVVFLAVFLAVAFTRYLLWMTDKPGSFDRCFRKNSFRLGGRF
jgi:hypothetical protein